MDSGGFADFFRQVPTTIFVMLCASGLLLVVVSVLIVAARIRKAQARAQTPFASSPTYPEPYSSSYSGMSDSADLPDLDMLVSTPPPAGTPAQPAPRPKRTGTYMVTLADGRNVEAVNVMTIARDLADGSLIVQIGDKAYPTGTPITDPEVTRRFTGTIRELVRLASMSNSASAAKAPEVPQPAPAEDVPDFLSSAASAPEAPSRPAAPPLPKGAVLPGDLPKYRDMEMQPIARGKGKKMEPVPELNIADAIETYLQFKLQQSPGFRGRNIHVHPAPGGGVKIEADGLYYDAVADVTDPDVRDFIASAIQEWQERQ